MYLLCTCCGTYTGSRLTPQCPATRCTWFLRSDRSPETSSGETFACRQFFRIFGFFPQYKNIITLNKITRTRHII